MKYSVPDNFIALLHMLRSVSRKQAWEAEEIKQQGALIVRRKRGKLDRVELHFLFGNMG